MFFFSTIKKIAKDVEDIKQMVGGTIRVTPPAVTKGSTFTVNEYAHIQRVPYATTYERVQKLKESGAVVPSRKRKDLYTNRTTVTYKYSNQNDAEKSN